MTSDNIMWDGETSRWQLTLGQVFRMNFDARSILNINGVRGVPTPRPCARSSSDGGNANQLCPRMGAN